MNAETPPDTQGAARLRDDVLLILIDLQAGAIQTVGSMEKKN